MESAADKALPVLDTRKVLEEHLTAKLYPLLFNKSNVSEAVNEVTRDLTNQDLIRLLEDEVSLELALSKTSAYCREKEELGEELFCRVSAIEPDICAKITGMLLELNNRTVRQFLDCEDLLLQAVDKSKREYFVFSEECRLKEEAGEKIYDWVLKRHSPEIAAQITGMLLELRLEELNDIIWNEKELERKTRKALEVFVKYHS